MKNKKKRSGKRRRGREGKKIQQSHCVFISSPYVYGSENYYHTTKWDFDDPYLKGTFTHTFHLFQEPA
jgi:hypothetical protein